MAREEKRNQTTDVTPAAALAPKKKFRATAPQSSASFLECEINNKKTTLANGEIIELTEQEKNRVSASCTWNFEEVK